MHAASSHSNEHSHGDHMATIVVLPADAEGENMRCNWRKLLARAIDSTLYSCQQDGAVSRLFQVGDLGADSPIIPYLR